METQLIVVFLTIQLCGAQVVLGQQNECITPVSVSCFRGGEARGLANSIETRIIPEVEFNCCGTITGWRVAGRAGPGTQFPTLQIWRRNNNTCGEYFRTGESIIMENSVPSPQVDCDVIEHTLNERDRISVQPGDVIGIELPPLFDQAFQVLFEPGGELNYIYRQQLPDTVELQGPSLSSVFREQALIDLTVIPDGTCSANTLSTTIDRAHDSKNDTIKDAIISVLGGITGALLLIIILILACLVYLIVKYYRDVHAIEGGGGGGEKGMIKPRLPSRDAGTQTANNNDLIWQISTEENISYNLMADHVKKTAPSKGGKLQLPVPAIVVGNHFKSPTHDSKGVRSGKKKSKRPPPLPKTEQVSDSVKQVEKKANPPPLAPKPTKIAELMKRFEN